MESLVFSIPLHETIYCGIQVASPHRGTDKLRVCVFYALKIVRYSFVIQKLAYKYAISVFTHSVVLKCERFDLFMFTFSVGLFLHFL